jgi:APA family basic amino acid/polyamine antiporter
MPARTLSVKDVVFIVVGIVVGAGIFGTPALVAGNSSSDFMVLAVWVAGGVIALTGALCYGELASTYPSTGGDYHFLFRAFGRDTAFLFAWARLAIMQTGSIALLAFVFGDYMSQLLSLGPYSSAVYAALAIIVFTAINMIGIREGTRAQMIFTIIEVGGVAAIALICLFFADPVAPAEVAAAGDAPAGPSAAGLGLAMVFVLLTYGGWNEGAYVSAELRGKPNAMARALVLGIFLVTVLYLLVNLGYLRVLGREGMAGSEAVAADAMRLVFGAGGVAFASLLVAVSSLTSLNASVITGARCNFAMGNDFPLFRVLAKWDYRGNTPRNALVVQGVISLLLVLLGASTRSGFQTAVEYTAPVFWLFFLLTGISLFRLRQTDPNAVRPFRVPLYPVVPLIFCATSAYMLWNSVSYTGLGALVGVAVLIAGLPIMLYMRGREARSVT